MTKAARGDDMAGKPIIFNGLDGATGKYLFSHTPAEITELAREDVVDEQQFLELRHRSEQANGATLGARYGVDACDLAQAGWAIFFPADGDPEVETALTELIEHRRAQAAKEEKGRFRIFRGDDGYRRGDTWDDIRN
jgi:hypothetical protein